MLDSFLLFLIFIVLGVIAISAFYAVRSLHGIECQLTIANIFNGSQRAQRNQKGIKYE